MILYFYFLILSIKEQYLYFSCIIKYVMESLIMFFFLIIVNHFYIYLLGQILQYHVMLFYLIFMNIKDFLYLHLKITYL